jgi:hypothetical protein
MGLPRIPSEAAIQNDQFDNIMDSALSVWKKGGSFDVYGIPSQNLTLLLIDVPCRYDMSTGQEITSDAGFGKQIYYFYMRLIQVDNPPGPLNIHHWLQINDARGVNVGAPDPEGTMFDIKNIRNVADHHLEVEALLIEP